MMGHSDRHGRYLQRLLSRHALLYSEMLCTNSLLHGPADLLLAHSPSEQPVALQLGGCNPRDLAACAALGERAGYAEINLNCGCPSPRVQRGAFGARLMLRPQLVADCLAAMQDAVSVPVTLKCRLGVDRQDDYQSLCDFVGTACGSGCSSIIVHARKAWLSGLSARENRIVPPLNYEAVYRLKRDFPDLEIIINGGIISLSSATAHLRQVDGVMLGRRLWHEPYLLAGVDRLFYGGRDAPPSRLQVLQQYSGYVRERLAEPRYARQFPALVRPLLGLFRGQRGGRAFRRALSCSIRRADPLRLLQQATDITAAPHNAGADQPDSGAQLVDM